MRKRLHVILISLLCACACQQQGATDLASFVANDTVRLEFDGVSVFTYVPNTCQLAYNEQRCEFRAHTDTMLDYFVITMDEVPGCAGTAVNATIVWSTSAGERTKENVTLYAKRIRGDVIWLCDDSRHTAAVVRVLE